MKYSEEISTNFSSDFNELRNVCIQFLNNKTVEQIGDTDLVNLYQLAKRHRLHRLLTLLPSEEKKNDELNDLLQKNTKRALSIVAELMNVQKVLDKGSIQFLILKGPAIGQMLYSAPLLRSSRDLDILVKSSELEKVEHLLMTEGYNRVFPSIKLSRKQNKFFVKQHNQSVYSHPNRNVKLEIHWRLFKNSTPIEEEQTLFKLPFSVEINSKGFNTLPPALLFKYLCIHGANHRWSALNWLLDVSLLIEKHNEDWEGEFETAKEIGVKRSIAQMFILRELVFNLPAPTYISDFYKKDENLKSLLEYTLKSMSQSDTMNLERSFANFNRIKKYRSSLGTAGDSSFSWFTINDFELISLPDSIFWFYIPLRPFLWCWRYLK